ncbi:hypothetical protein A7E78_09130 [Syntrophotalea acetylenivorans]|uniref:Uncharacterized protein n=1 Tax=Syntrophotalea acetylenivorans TaxID=1842532 RepID=A0A1L3GQ01_9BACT|nr:hypothetical protein [Syntrophotalea acetylenivorans]APG27985.1 hypothetical protein A7E78_09130 [Syntrophotalea acetylenivorans]
MKRFRKAICCFVAILLMPMTGFAGDWPNIERSLQGWQGEKQVLLRSSLADPLMSPLVQDLLEDLLSEGYTVLPVEAKAVAKSGLMLDLRITDGNEILALRRAEDGAIIAFERRSVQALPSAVEVKEPVVSQMVPPAVVQPVAVAATTVPSAAVTPVPSGATTVVRRESVTGPLYGPLALSGQPRNLALLAGEEIKGLQLGLLYDEKLVHYRLGEFGLESVGEFSPELGTKRALHLDAADLDDDGTRELAVLWAEDVQGIYQGTDSKLHAWLLAADMKPLVADLSGYLRLSGQQAALQKRGPYTPFKGPVLGLGQQAGEWTVGDKPLDWGGTIYATTPLDQRLALGNDKQGRLQLVDRKHGRPLPGGLLLQDLGDFSGPQVAVSLENPQYRSGFSKEDLVREEYHALPSRKAVAGDGSVYTVRRGRSAGLPLVGKPSGQDRIVRVVPQDNRLLLEEPFPGVDAYILDFALLERPGKHPAVILLLNDREDGKGAAHLLIQGGR